MVLCRDHPDRVHQTQESNSTRANIARRTHSLAKMGSSACEETVIGSHADERVSGTVACVLGLQDEGMFRKVVG